MDSFLQKGATFLHIACSEGSVKRLQHIIRDGSLLPKELLMATDKVEMKSTINYMVVVQGQCTHSFCPGRKAGTSFTMLVALMISIV